MTTAVDSTKSSSVLAAYNSSSSASSSATGSDSTIDDVQNRFLTLLVAQMENQNPLNPLDNTEVTNQLAQMSTVRGIEQLNSKLSSLVDSLGDSQAVQASALIDKTVLVPGQNITLSDGKAYAGVNLASAADTVTVKIYDQSGALVQTESLGKADVGNLLFSWDGKTASGGDATNGAYSFKVTATKGSTSVDAEALQIGTVSALTRSAAGNFVLDLGSYGQYSFSDVQQVF